MKKILALVLVAAVILGMTACSRKKTDGNDGKRHPDPYDEYDSYDARSQAIYDDALGEFYEAYQTAREETNLSRRYALMAVAEAKLLASAVMLPLTASGGTYAISRVAPYTGPYALWGNDADRFHDLLVTTQPIQADHINHMKAKWAELRGTGTYWSWAKSYLKEKGYTLRRSHSLAYSADPQTWDVLASSRASDSEAIVNTYDGLYEYDQEGTLQPALAKSHTVRTNEDGTVDYIFHLKSGLKWVDSQGRQVAKVQADDFVAGMQHMMDAAGGLEYLVEGLIVNASAYISGELTDFSQVGVKALDETTLVYTLTEECPYFMTMLGYGVFAPMSRSFYTGKGGRFGPDFDDAAESYTYGKSPDDIAYCGPYLVTNATAENTIVFRANPSYWNADGIQIQTITWKYNDGRDALKAYQDTMSGTIDGTGLNASSLEKAKADGVFNQLAYVTPSNATTFFAFYNLDRRATANFNDGTAAATSKSEGEQIRTRIALRNVHFRRALSFATDRGAYHAQTVGEDLKYAAVRNCFTPGNFVALPEAVTVEIAGRAVTYPAGTDYGKIMQDQLDGDGVPIRVWNPDGAAGAGSSDGFDGWYDPEAARQELEKAVTELKGQGIPVSSDSPIQIELPYFSGNDADANRANAYKQSVEKALGGAVRVRLVECPDTNSVLYAGYYITIGSEANYDVYDRSGWGPDYGDPQTYLDTLLPGYEGYMTRMLGIF